MYKLIFHPTAELELLDAFDWYEEQQPGLGNQFLSEIDKLLNNISSSPQRYKAVKTVFREALVERFPYVVTFKITQKMKTIFISAVYHTSRAPNKKFRT